MFNKNIASVTTPYGDIIIPSVAASPLEVDYEVELAVVISKEAKDVSVDNALDYVLGYVCLL